MLLKLLFKAKYYQQCKAKAAELGHSYNQSTRGNVIEYDYAD